MNRVSRNGYPGDVVLLSRFNELLVKIFHPSLINMYLENKLNQKFDHEMYGLKPKHRYVPMGEQSGNGQGTN